MKRFFTIIFVSLSLLACDSERSVENAGESDIFGDVTVASDVVTHDVIPSDAGPWDADMEFVLDGNAADVVSSADIGFDVEFADMVQADVGEVEDVFVVDASDDTVVDTAAEEDVQEVEYILDDLLRFNHMQCLGTHNSYHKKPLAASFVPPWDYEHLPLDEQAGLQGVRQFELDVYFNDGNQEFDVYHVPVLDQETTCATLGECLEALKGWSDLNLDHTPLYVLVEWKDGFNGDVVDERLAILEETVLAIWPWERLIGPDWIQGEEANVRDGLAANGWPTLSALRGRMMLILHDGGEVRDAYTNGGTSTEGKVFFPDAYGDTSLPFAAHHSMNGPIGGFEAIQSVVNQGHLVRTRADSDSEEANALDYSRFEAALDSGAHFISTDYPFPGDEENYGVVIPGGTPSRCNPLTAPEECTSEAIENAPMWEN